MTRLVALDPAAADAIEANNGRRIVRALEVVEITGRPFSATMPTREHLLPTVLLGLGADRPVLDERIDRRVRRMWQDGPGRRGREALSRKDFVTDGPRRRRSATARPSPRSTGR